MRLFKNLKARILKSIITWSEMGKQTAQAKEVYYATRSKRKQGPLPYGQRTSETRTSTLWATFQFQRLCNVDVQKIRMHRSAKSTKQLLANYIDFLKSPSSCLFSTRRTSRDFVARSAASRP